MEYFLDQFRSLAVDANSKQQLIASAVLDGVFCIPMFASCFIILFPCLDSIRAFLLHRHSCLSPTHEGTRLYRFYSVSCRLFV